MRQKPELHAREAGTSTGYASCTAAACSTGMPTGRPVWRPGPGRPAWSTPEEVAQRVRYIHDELGGRVRFPAAGGDPPGFQLAPFLWRQGGRQEALSMLWPIRRAPAPRPCAAAATRCRRARRHQAGAMPVWQQAPSWPPFVMHILLEGLPSQQLSGLCSSHV